MNRLARLGILGVVLGLLAGPAQAVIIASGDGTGNTGAPADDPGWENVVFLIGSIGAVYLGDGWVLTANHGFGGPSNPLPDVWIPGNGVYKAVQGSKVQLQTGGSNADLAVFQIVRDPGLPDIPVRSGALGVGLQGTLVGYGRSRGGASSGICAGLKNGWDWATPNQKRWGTNLVEETGIDLSESGMLTRSFSTDFSASGQTQHEAQAALGDSGGAVFVKNGATWEVAGIIVSIEQCKPGAALYGDLTLAADLSFYAGQIAAATSVPACDDGVDQDGDGLVDYPDDPGCSHAQDPFETSDALPCDDGVDNDGDTTIDFPNDAGCLNSTWVREDPQCEDDVDNDGDGGIDWDGGPGGGSADPQCQGTPWKNREAKSSCGLGVELALLLPPLMALRRARQP